MCTQTHVTSLIDDSYVCVPYVIRAAALRRRRLYASAEQQLWRIYLMKYVIVVGIAASATAIAGLTLVDVVAAPTSDVGDTVRTLEADGYHVIVNRAGAAALSGCTVSAVRPGAPAAATVYVDVAC